MSDEGGEELGKVRRKDSTSLLLREGYDIKRDENVGNEEY